MRDTKEYWQDIHDQVENVIYKGHADLGWDWMFRLSLIMLNKCAQKNPAAATTGNKEQSKLIYSPSLSRKGCARHA
ncbi:hypothetical protein EFO83_11885 [Lacticaseibacillus rhamnosus]|uniref:hypothetical protein n=1 Tax=Lacticaseibacillus rhamnosus TaxID=47715 RepID=UPI0007E107A5|nr:hypothetical protein [Lacticaseibacillus rhamnosus]MCT3192686.1 hypothetical protein [Lacticaseibacillus rhamnosus]MCT3372813.1 hypothetical protein [Lacticaseibacillus rhamnosus]MDA3725675.1 hypothetical protein [Lacticaseibacillus rhamnosus]MDA3736804.1 hypothetical protein [Lacticaseibacillus rhamnosus]MDA3741783.1 hypothetical protein [Lacticaseibacillus rhamnosus]